MRRRVSNSKTDLHRVDLFREWAVTKLKPMIRARQQCLVERKNFELWTSLLTKEETRCLDFYKSCAPS